MKKAKALQASSEGLPIEVKEIEREVLPKNMVVSPTTITLPISQIDDLVIEVKKLEKEEKLESIDDLLDRKMMSTEERILEEAQIVTADIVPRIRQLESLSDMEAENEMKLLKAALMANPEAVSLMLPTDVGLLTATLRRITKEAMIEAASKVKPKKEKKVDAKNIQAMLADVDDF